MSRSLSHLHMGQPLQVHTLLVAIKVAEQDSQHRTVAYDHCVAARLLELQHYLPRGTAIGGVSAMTVQSGQGSFDSSADLLHP